MLLRVSFLTISLLNISLNGEFCMARTIVLAYIRKARLVSKTFSSVFLEICKTSALSEATMQSH